jgi:O-antigen/teichoic acid export membrane protein
MPTLARHATRQRAASDIAMQVTVRIFNLAIGAVVTALLVRTLGATHYGQWSTLLAVIALVSYLANFGTEGVALREAAKQPEIEHEWIGSVMMLRLMAIVPVMGLSIGAVLVLPHTEAMLIAGAILIVGMPFGGVSALGLLFRLRVDNRIPMLVLTIRSVLWGVGVLVVHLDGGGLVALAAAMLASDLIGGAVNVVAALKVAPRRPRPVFRHVRKLVKIAITVGLSGLLVYAYAQVDLVIVYTVRGSREAGLYGAVYNLLNQSHFVPLAILTTLGPVLAASWPDDPARLKRAARQTAELLSVVSFGGLAFTIVAARPVVTLVFGEAFAEAAPALPVLLGAFVLISYGYLNGNLMVILGKQGRLLRVSLLALIVNVVGNLILVPLAGFMAAAWMTLATEAVVLFSTSRLLAEELGIRRPAVGRLVRTAVAAVLFGLGLAAVHLAGGPLVVLIAVAAVLYPSLLFVLGAISRDDVLLVLKRRPAT